MLNAMHIRQSRKVFTLCTLNLSRDCFMRVLQGGHVALKYALTARRAPAACIALSTWLEPDTSSVRKHSAVLLL